MSEAVMMKEKELVDTRNITLDELLGKANDIQKDCSDYTITKASDKNVRVGYNANIIYQCDSGEVRDSSISRYAFGQLCSKIGVPAQYIEKCINTGRLDLAQDNVSSWISDYNNDLFIREHNGKIRGVLTPKFSRCDTPEIIEVLKENIDDLSIKGYYLSPERFHLRAVDRTPIKVPNEDLFVGVTVNSSDVGRSILSVNYLLYKKVCTNGLCLPQTHGSIFQQKHIGVTPEVLKSGLSERLSLLPQITEGVIKMIEEQRNSGVVIRDFDNTEEIEKLIKELRVGAKMSEEQATNVVNLFSDRLKASDFRYENNRWGLINAITEVSKESTLERRIELESYAGRLLVA